MVLASSLLEEAEICIEYLSTLRGGDVLSEEDAMWAIQKADMGVAPGSSMWRNSL